MFNLNRYTKTFGPFKGWHYHRKGLTSEVSSVHYLNNEGSFARDHRLEGNRVFQELRIEKYWGAWCLFLSDGYRDKILKRSTDLNRILYAAIEHQENDNTWNDIVKGAAC